MQPFYYANASGASISGTCPTVEGLANEVAAEWISKHPEYAPNQMNGQTMVAYVSEHHLSFFESKSYDKAYACLKARGPQNTAQSAGSFCALNPSICQYSSGPQGATQPATSAPRTAQDIFQWFDESAPAPGAPLFEVLITARAYDGALAILRQARQGNMSVKSGTSVLDTNYHPSTANLDSWQTDNPNSAPSLFYWQGEELIGTTPIMHFQMTQRAYEQMLALVAGSDLRIQPSR